MPAKESEMSSSVELKSVKDTEMQMEISNSNIDTRIPDKKDNRSSSVKILWFVVVLALAVAVAAVVAVVVVTNKSNEVDKFINLQQSAAQIGKTTKEVTTTTSVATTPMTTERELTTGIETTTHAVITTTIPEDHSICQTPECVVAAARLYQNMDQTVHPCDDFYEYACGGWIKDNPILDDDSSINQILLLYEDMAIMLKGLLETVSGDDEVEGVTKAKNLYKSCLDLEQIEQRRIEPLEMIYAMFGKWPMLHNSWNESGFDLIDSMIAIRAYGPMPLISAGVGQTLENSTVHKLWLDQPSLLFPTFPGYIPHFQTYILNLAEALGAKNMTQVKQDVDDMFEFDIAVANLTVPYAQRMDPNNSYNLMTMDDIYMNITEKFDWMRLVGGMMNITGVEIPITGEEPVIVKSPVYLRNVIDLIEKTPQRILANYLLTGQILRIVPFLPKNIRDIRSEYRKVFYGKQPEVARWRHCLAETNTFLRNAVGRLFVDNFFDEDAEVMTSDMVVDLRSAFNYHLNELEWMDEETRRAVKGKADAVSELIGYSERLVKNDTNLNGQYEELRYNSTTYFENAMMTGRVLTIQGLRRLREPVEIPVIEDMIPPTDVGAYYAWRENKIVFPAGILQPPFFFKHYPKSLNYGGIGVVMGHEITHGFDNNGRLYDKNGDRKTWWNESISKKFTAKAQCLVDQYSNFTVPELDLNLNGTQTLGENIADNGGIKQAFTAYREWVRKQGKEEPKLPGLKLNNNQLFFLNFAQLWCANNPEQDLKFNVLYRNHSPGRYRVLGSLQNSKEFSKVFNCPKSSYMNPQMKCRVW